MTKITITKSKRGHYHLTVRDDRGAILLQDKFDTLDHARRLASTFKTPTYAQLQAALAPCGK